MRNSQLRPLPAGTKMVIRHTHDPDMLKYDTLPHTKKSPRYATLAVLFSTETGEILGIGESYCSPRDVPSRKRGRIIAHNRALVQYEGR